MVLPPATEQRERERERERERDRRYKRGTEITTRGSHGGSAMVLKTDHISVILSIYERDSI